MLNLINIYDNFKASEELFTLISILPDNFQIWGKINGRYQFYKTTNDKSYLIVIYQSNNDNKYNIVAIKLFTEYKNVSIYNKLNLNDIDYYNIKKDYKTAKALNPAFLELYFNKIFTCDNIEFYLNSNEANNNISDQVGLDNATEFVSFSGDIQIDWDNDDSQKFGIIPLYYLNDNDLLIANLSCDNPNNFYHPWNASYNQQTGKIEYNVTDGIYDKTFYDYTVYFSLTYIFNYNYNFDDNSCDYLKNNLYLINNEQSYFDTNSIDYMTELNFLKTDGTYVHVNSEIKKSAETILPDNLYEMLNKGYDIVTDNVSNIFNSENIYDSVFGGKYALWNFAKSINSNIMITYYHDALLNYPDYESNVSPYVDNVRYFKFYLMYGNNSIKKQTKVIGIFNSIKINHVKMIEYYTGIVNNDLYYRFNDNKYYYIYKHNISGLTNAFYVSGGENHFRCVDGWSTSATATTDEQYKVIPYEIQTELTNVNISNTWDVCYDTIVSIHTINRIFEDFNITGLIINENNSDSVALNDILSSNYQYIVDKMNNYMNNGKLDIRKQPLPNVISNGGSYKFNNVAPLSVISWVYDNLYSQDDIKNIYYNGGINNIINIRDNLNNGINNTTALSQSEKDVYNTFCKKYSNLTASFNGYSNERQMFLVENKHTSEKEVVSIYTTIRKYTRSQIWYNSKSQTSTYKYLRYYTDSTNNAIDYFGVSLYINQVYPLVDSQDAIQFTKIRLNNIDSLIGNTGDGQFVINIVNFETGEKQTGVTIDVDISDFTHVNDYYIFDIVDYIHNTLNKQNFYPYSLDFKMLYSTVNVGFSYYDRIGIKCYTNFDNVSNSRTITLRVTATNTSGTNDVNEVRCNIQDKIDEVLLPQKSYSIPLSFEVFDIMENMYNVVPDNKSIIMLNNYIGNNINNLTLSDLTVTDSEYFFIFDRIRTEYDRYTNLIKNIPFKSHQNEYCRLYIKYDIPSESAYLFDSFEFVNVYNNSLYDSTLGHIYLEGKISDWTNGMVFDDTFKIYKIVNNFTITSNVPSTIKLPINITLTFKFYDTFDDFTNDGTHTEIVYDDYIMYDIVNRGDAITPTSDWFPKLFYIIEYYEIYPQYSWQQEKEYIYNLYFTLESAVDEIKVSEVFFDVCFMTSDIYVGIPEDYSNASNIEEITNFKQSNDKDEILDFINYYVRHKCQNCTKMNYKIKVKIIPSYFGMNICGFTFSSYTYNIKFEWYIPYLFYKESADTIIMINKDSVIEKENIPISLSDSAALLSLIDNDTINLLNLDSTNFVTTSEMPKHSKVTLTLFNSSSNPKELMLEMYNNNSPISDNNLDITNQIFNLAPFDIRQISIYQNLDSTLYDDTFNSGIVYYNLYERTKGYSQQNKIYDKIELPIPTLNEYITKYMSLLERATSIIESRYTKLQVVVPDERREWEVDKKSNVNIKYYNESSNEYIKYGNQGYGNINDYYNLAIKYIVMVDYDDVNKYTNLFEPFGNLIYIKIPYNITREYHITPKMGKEKQFNLDSTLNYNVNNLYDTNSDNYIYLIGQKTDVNKWEFRFEGLFEFKDDTLYNRLLNLYGDDINKIESTLLNITLSFPNIQLLLFSLFEIYGTQAFNYVVDNFINIDTFTNSYDDIISKFTDMLASKINLTDEYIPVTRVGLVYGYEKVQGGIIQTKYDIGVGNVILVDYGTGQKQGKVRRKKKQTLAKKSINDKILSYFGVESGISERYATALKVIKKALTDDIRTEDDDIINVDDWLFDDVHNVIYNNIQHKTFSGEYLTYPTIPIYFGNLLNNIVDLKFDIDNSKDRINNIIIFNESDNPTYLQPYTQYYTDSNSNIIVALDIDNFKFSTIRISINEKTFYVDNLIYPIWNQLIEKLKKKPLTVTKYFDDSEQIVIKQSTNYSKIFEIPLVINKSLDSYFTIERIRITENGVYNNDYIVRFGDMNERYTRRASNNVADITINKIIDKYTPGIKFVISAFNIPNTTGQYFTTILIYYDFNGNKYVMPIDMNYQVILPQSIDNEQLIYSVEKIDGIDIGKLKETEKDIYKKKKCLLENSYMKGGSGTPFELTRWFK